jgi:hypothetical protein
MKGVVFNLLENVTTATYGERTWDDVLDAADLEGAYTSLGSYPDDHLARLVGAVADATERPATDVVRWFGRHAIPRLAEAYPGFFSPHRTTREFLQTLNDIIHPEVRKLYPGADVPDFGMTVSDDGLTMSYASKRRLCAFAEGLIEGAADHYGEHATIVQPQCMNRGDATCELEISIG